MNPAVIVQVFISLTVGSLSLGIFHRMTLQFGLPALTTSNSDGVPTNLLTLSGVSQGSANDFPTLPGISVRPSKNPDLISSTDSHMSVNSSKAESTLCFVDVRYPAMWRIRPSVEGSNTIFHYQVCLPHRSLGTNAQSSHLCISDRHRSLCISF